MPRTGQPTSNTAGSHRGAPGSNTLAGAWYLAKLLRRYPHADDPLSYALADYNAGRGQRYYLFGTTGSFLDVVTFYRNALKQKGDLVFDAPATHEFIIGRYREETMAFPPGVTVKDWTSGGSKGYPNPKMGEEPARFPTVIMIVPAPAGAGGR